MILNKKKFKGGGVKMREKVLKVLGLGAILGSLAFSAVITDVSSKAWGKGPHGIHAVDTNQTIPASETYQKFYQDTQALRQKIWQTKEELRLLYLQSNPDWKAIGEKKATLAQLTTELQRKAKEYGIPYAYGRGMGMRMGMGGSKMAGIGMGCCGCPCQF